MCVSFNVTIVHFPSKNPLFIDNKFFNKYISFNFTLFFNGKAIIAANISIDSATYKGIITVNSTIHFSVNPYYNIVIQSISPSITPSIFKRPVPERFPTILQFSPISVSILLRLSFFPYRKT